MEHIFKFIDTKSGEVTEVKLSEVAAIHIFQGDKNFVIHLKSQSENHIVNDGKGNRILRGIHGKRYLRNSPFYIFKEHFIDCSVGTGLHLVIFNDIIEGKKVRKLTLGK